MSPELGNFAVLVAGGALVLALLCLALRFCCHLCFWHKWQPWTDPFYFHTEGAEICRRCGATRFKR
jgi:hypothetical protein